MGDEIVKRALSSLGKGFDFTSDFRLRFCKGESRLVMLNEDEKRRLMVPGFGAFDDVSGDIKCDKGDQSRYKSDILDFNQMSEFFNKKCSVTGKIPSGLFNSMFKFESSSWGREAGNSKYLGLDCYTTVLVDIHVDRYPLLLAPEVSCSVPSSWDPHALARFIEKYGTHIIVGLSIGGQDLVLVKQEKASKLGPSELKKHLDELGDQLFNGTCNFTPLSSKAKNRKQKAPSAFKVFDTQPAFQDSCSSATTKDGITVICTKRGGDPSAASHCEWLLTVPTMPDVVHFSLIPITSLLKNVPGKGFLSHAINLYLRHKPPIAELEYFLDFQSHRTWAPAFGDLPLAPTTNVPLLTSALHVNLMGPRLYINTSQVVVEKRPVVGMRLHLEGMKGNRLAIHLQHLSTMPTLYQNKFEDTSQWKGSDETADTSYFEGIQRQKLSYVCTAPVTYEPPSTSGQGGVSIVTGARLHIKKHGPKLVLHLSLLFTRVSSFFVVKSSWVQGTSGSLQKLSLLSSISSSISGSLEKESEQTVVVDSSIYPAGPPVTGQAQKLLRVVDTAQICQGPHDSPGYWLVTGAKLGLESGKVGLNIEFSLLNRC